MSYYLAPCLDTLRDEINATWPHRQTYADGWIGDASHQARRSDHNPDWDDGGVVRALDVTAAGISPDALVRAACRDDRTNYVIHDRLIYQRKYGFSPRRYYGSNPHLSHVHISIRHGRQWENDRSGWLVERVANTVASGGDLPDVPDLDLPEPLEADMPLNDTDLEKIQAAVHSMKVGATGLTLGVILDRVNDRTKDIPGTIHNLPIGRTGASLATLLERIYVATRDLTGDPEQTVAAISDEDLARIAQAVNDEQHRRSAS